MPETDSENEPLIPANKGLEYHLLISQLREAGRSLLHPPNDDDDELQQLLVKLEKLLSKVDELAGNNDKLMIHTLQRPMKALLNQHLLQHSREDVKASVASCLCEITRITAPKAPYVNKEHTKRVFECIVSSLEGISSQSLAKMKRVSILQRVSKLQSCLIMLDLKFDDLIVRLIKRFSKSVESHDTLCTYMADIMELVIEESDDFLPVLLETLKQTKPLPNTESSRLREKLMRSCAAKLQLIKDKVDHGDTVPEIVSSDDAAAHVNGETKNKRKRKEVGDEGSVAKKGKLSGNETSSDAKPVKTTSGGVSEPDDDVNNKDVESESDDMLLKPCGKNAQKHNLASWPSEDDVANKDGETLNLSENKDEDENSDTHLRFLCEKFDTSHMFSDFVENFLVNRPEIDVFSVKLTFCAKIVSLEIMKRILNYAFSHNLQELTITSLNYKEEWFELCPSLLNSKSLKHLTLDGYTHHQMSNFTWDLPDLVTLNLYHFHIYNYDERVVFSLTSCTKLKNLTMKNCSMGCSRGFDIEHAGLTSLTLEEGLESRGTAVCVDVPLLENITIRNWQDIHLFITPNLSSLCYIDYGVDPLEEDYGDDFCEEDSGDDLCDEEDNEDDLCYTDYADSYYGHDEYPFEIFDQNRNYLKDVLICIDRPIESKKDILKWISMLHKLLPPVRSLTLNLEFAKLLAPHLESRHYPKFNNLKDVKVFQLVFLTTEWVDNKLEFKLEQVPAHVPAKFKNFLKNTSPQMKISLHEEKEKAISTYNYKLAVNLIKELEVLLEDWRKQAASFKRLSIPADERLEISTTFCCRTASFLRMIKLTLTRVPPSLQASNLHAMYNTLYAEHVTLTKAAKKKKFRPPVF